MPRRVASRGPSRSGGGLVLAAGAVLHGPALRWAMAWGLLLDRPGADGDALVPAVRLLAGAALAALAGTVLLRAGREAAAPVSRPSSRHAWWPTFCSLTTT